MQFLHQLNHFTPLPRRLNLRQTHRLNLRRQVPDFVQRLVASADIVVRYQVDDFVGDFVGRSNFVQSSDSAKAADVNVSMIRKHPPSRLNMMFCDLCNAFTDRITISCSDCMIARSRLRRDFMRNIMI